MGTMQCWEEIQATCSVGGVGGRYRQHAVLGVLGGDMGNMQCWGEKIWAKQMCPNPEVMSRGGTCDKTFHKGEGGSPVFGEVGPWPPLPVP